MVKNNSTPKIPLGDPRAQARISKLQACPNCFRPQYICICEKVISFSNRVKIVILQHPREQSKLLNSARLAHLALKNSKIRIGLSWPNFKAVAGPDQLPSNWAVLYMNSSKSSKPCQIVDRHNKEIPDSSFIKGIIVLDGSWKQAKALWWRNPWLLRLNRITLNPDCPSLRGQTKAQAMSTVEAIAMALESIGEKKEISESLRTQYARLIVSTEIPSVPSH
jgi:DTW domain-containing protein YfiP